MSKRRLNCSQAVWYVVHTRYKQLKPSTIWIYHSLTHCTVVRKIIVNYVSLLARLPDLIIMTTTF